MSFVSQYLLEVKPQIERAIDNALPDLAQGLKQKIEEKARQNVYSYPATASAMAKRRGMLGGAANISMHMGDKELTLINETTLQHASAKETQIVEEGWGNYRQPGPRPFMDEARDEYVDSGEADATLANVLRSYGFTVF